MNNQLATWIEDDLPLWPHGTWNRGRLPKKEILETALLTCGFKTALPLPKVTDGDPYTNKSKTAGKRTTGQLKDVAVQKAVNNGNVKPSPLVEELKKWGVTTVIPMPVSQLRTCLVVTSL